MDEENVAKNGIKQCAKCNHFKGSAEKNNDLIVCGIAGEVTRHLFQRGEKFEDCPHRQEEEQKEAAARIVRHRRIALQLGTASEEEILAFEAAQGL